MTDEIIDLLFKAQDTAYRDFNSKLIPTVDKQTVIGVRTPELRTLAKKLSKTKEIEVFLNVLPHKYFEENQLHAFIISLDKNYNSCIESVEKFLPYVNNWATCDQLSPVIFKKHKDELLERINIWLKSERTYTVRFAVKMLMTHFLDEDFKTEYADMVSRIRTDEYYINMMTAWYFATALSKQYDRVLPFITEKRLDAWTHNKAIQKAVESRRITDEQKSFLRQHRIIDKQGNGSSRSGGGA